MYPSPFLYCPDEEGIKTQTKHRHRVDMRFCTALMKKGLRRLQRSAACGINGCHVSGFEWGDFTSYAGVKEQAESGRLWLLVGVVRTMPPQNSLFEEDLEMLKCWLDEGARDN